MEDWQREHIQKNLVELIKNTSCNAELIAILKSKHVLGQNDAESLESVMLTSFERSKKLYEILITRTDSYGILLEALSQLKQSGSAKILKQHNPIFRNFGKISYDRNHVLGTGSNGTKVFKGTFGGRDVAIKVINADVIDPEIAQREIDFLKRLDSHENIIKYHVAECEDNFIYIALELCIISFQDEIKLKLVNINPLIALEKCTKGLAHLHRSNVIHRDLKPANILLGYNEQVKISDFGLSKQIPLGMTSVSIHSGVLGTADWMAPEVLKLLAVTESMEPLKLSTSSDVFSLGCVYYFVLTNGSHPFGDPVHRQSNILSNNPQISNSNMESSWIHLIDKMISDIPSKRPTCKEVLATYFVQPGEKQRSKVDEKQDLNFHPKKSMELKTNQISELRKIIVDNAFSLEDRKKVASSTEVDLRNMIYNSNKLNSKYQYQPAQVTQNDLFTLVNRVDDHGNNLIFRHILLKGPIDELRHLVEIGGDWNIRNKKESSVLHYAVKTGNLAAINYFISLGADINARDSLMQTPFHYLAFNFRNFRETLGLLKTAGADVNAVDSNGNNLLFLATLQQKTIEDLTLIKAHGVELSVENNCGETLFHVAAKVGHCEAITFFSFMGLHPNARDNSGEPWSVLGY